MPWKCPPLLSCPSCRASPRQGRGPTAVPAHTAKPARGNGSPSALKKHHLGNSQTNFLLWKESGHPFPALLPLSAEHPEQQRGPVGVPQPPRLAPRPPSPGKSMVVSSSGDSSKLMMDRWKVLLQLDCKWLQNSVQGQEGAGVVRASRL